MLLVSLKVNKKRIKIAAGLIGLLAIIAVGIGIGRPYRREVAVNLSGDGAVTKNYTAQTAGQRLEFISQFGWEVEEEPVEIEEVLIPAEFDAVYESYNTLQRAQGLDLTRYRGKMVKRFTYQVLNYPDSGDEVRLNLLVAENKVIGGDVCSMALDGFMHGFKYEG
ncbi:MAG: DUF4830 domain-containing protein [Provencibacterium sp.]|jgi:hypothetical protein|nr:DUF4830 domain-containing protein [Provencibacterium sp.]